MGIGRWVGALWPLKRKKTDGGFPHLHGPVAGELALFRVWIPLANSSAVTGRIAAATSSRLHSHPRRTHLSPPHSGVQFLPFLEGSGFWTDMAATALGGGDLRLSALHLYCCNDKADTDGLVVEKDRRAFEFAKTEEAVGP